MGLFGSFSGNGGIAAATSAFNPSSLLNSGGGFDTTGAVSGLLGGASEDGMRNLLGMDPASACPSGAGGGGGSGGGANDPCGKNDDPLKSALVGLGLAAAAPSIAALGGEIGDLMDSGLGAVSSTLGDGLSAVTGAAGGTLGLAPESPAQSVINSSLGAGSMIALGGGNLTDQGVGLLGGATDAVNDINSSEKSTGLFDSIKSTAGL